MNPDILLVREPDGYRVLHGHLRLTNILSVSDEAIVDVSGEGKVKLVKTRDGIRVFGEDASGGYLLFNRNESHRT